MMNWSMIAGVGYACLYLVVKRVGLTRGFEVRFVDAKCRLYVKFGMNNI